MKKWILILIAIVLSVSCATTAEDAGTATAGTEPDAVLTALSGSDEAVYDEPVTAAEPEPADEDVQAPPESITGIADIPSEEEAPVVEEEPSEEISITAEDDMPEYPSLADGSHASDTAAPEAEPETIRGSSHEDEGQVYDGEPSEPVSSEINQPSAVSEAATEEEAAAMTEPGGTVISVPEMPDAEKATASDDVILSDELSSLMLQIMGIFIIIIVLFTASVAIRSANKMPLSRGFAAVIAVLFSVLPIVISVIVIGRSLYWLLYLMLLLSYFIFRTKDRSYSFQ